MKLPNGVKYIIGIDEAGRGPLAGPVAVGACLVLEKMTRGILLKRVEKSGLKKLNDCKKLLPKRREMWLKEMKKMQDELKYSVTLTSNRIIDEKGLTFAIRKAMASALKKLERKVGFTPEQCLVLLDGGLKAPSRFLFQKTIIKGDEKEFAISLASIAAKVTRDRHMKRLSKKHPTFGFEFHKGYGTRNHIEAIKKEGITPVHRRSFLKNITKEIL